MAADDPRESACQSAVISIYVSVV